MFNERVAWLSGSPRLIELLGEIRRQGDRLRHRALSDPRRVTASAAEHLAILDAILAGDADGAARAAAAHLDSALSAALAPVPGAAA